MSVSAADGHTEPTWIDDLRLRLHTRSPAIGRLRNAIVNTRPHTMDAIAAIDDRIIIAARLDVRAAVQDELTNMRGFRVAGSNSLAGRPAVVEDPVEDALATLLERNPELVTLMKIGVNRRWSSPRLIYQIWRSIALRSNPVGASTYGHLRKGMMLGSNFEKCLRFLQG